MDRDTHSIIVGRQKVVVDFYTGRKDAQPVLHAQSDIQAEDVPTGGRNAHHTYVSGRSDACIPHALVILFYKGNLHGR